MAGRFILITLAILKSCSTSRTSPADFTDAAQRGLKRIGKCDTYFTMYNGGVVHPVNPVYPLIVFNDAFISPGFTGFVDTRRGVYLRNHVL
ncbi:MAG: hypothetical protein FMNOHCHN_01902 [Ignavibacteriaceae bacterium]|nr:hypothetical protein [Ignavibacteriaceae bacterium]